MRNAKPNSTSKSNANAIIATANTITNTDRNSYCNTNSHTYYDPETNAYRKTCSHIQAATNSGTAPVELVITYRVSSNADPGRWGSKRFFGSIAEKHRQVACAS
jgi:hypothetical protein